MYSVTSILLIVVAYCALALLVAYWAERRRSRRFSLTPLTYALSITVFTTTWTYYGVVGTAVQSGFLFLPIYLGPTLAFLFGTSVLKKMLLLKERYHFTSLADLISTRYGKSQALGVTTTLLATIALIPYIALQLKSMVVSTAILAGYPARAAYAGIGEQLAPLITLLVLLFTIFFGLRRGTPTARHPGVMSALAFAAITKLVAFMALGILITYGIFNGFDEILSRLSHSDNPFSRAHLQTPGRELLLWFTYLLLGFNAVLFLPRQFHVTVIENSDRRHLRTALWVFPTYLLLMTVFVIPIAGGGILLGFERAQADIFVLSLPIQLGARWLALAVFLGGIAAGAGMIVISLMAASTMVSNHLLVPALGLKALQKLRPLRRQVLALRWFSATVIVIAGFFFERVFGPEDNLTQIGMISFAAILQFAPATFGGLYWKRANRAGALLGMIGGSAVWFYTLILPKIASIGQVGQMSWIGPEFITSGPWGITWLRPEALFGLSLFPPLTHSVFWSLLFNITGLVTGSIAFAQSRQERPLAEEFVEILGSGVPAPSPSASPENLPKTIDLKAKIERLRVFLESFFDARTAGTLNQEILAAAGLTGEKSIGILQLAELRHQTEKALAATIGTPAAHAAIRDASLLTREESRQLSTVYADLVTELNVSPSELKERINYHQQRSAELEREALSAGILARASQQMFADLDLNHTLDAIVRAPLPEIADIALLFLPHGSVDGGSSARVAAIPEALEEMTAGIRSELDIPSLQRRLDSDPRSCLLLKNIVAVTQSLKPVISNPDSPDSSPDWSALLPEFPVQSSYTAPLVVRGTLIGVLALLSSSRGRFVKLDQLQLVDKLIRRASNALDNSLLYAKAQKAIQDREDFLSIASHEFRTPLTGLRTQVQLLARLAARNQLATYPIDKLSVLLQGSDHHIERLARLVNELLNIARARSGALQLNLEEIELGTLLRQSVEHLQPEILLKNSDVKLEIQEQIRARWDRIRIEEVVINLLSNAMKYAPGKPVEVKAWREKDRALFSVRDFGPGISKHDQSRIFMRFERVHRNTGVSGFGLGLYISQQIVQAHQGTIWVESETGKGSVFTVSLPLEIKETLQRPVDSSG